MQIQVIFFSNKGAQYAVLYFCLLTTNLENLSISVHRELPHSFFKKKTKQLHSILLLTWSLYNVHLNCFQSFPIIDSAPMNPRVSLSMHHFDMCNYTDLLSQCLY